MGFSSEAAFFGRFRCLLGWRLFLDDGPCSIPLECEMVMFYRNRSALLQKTTGKNKFGAKKQFLRIPTGKDSSLKMLKCHVVASH